MCRLDPHKAYLQERITAYPQLSGRRLLREIRALGYDGGYTAVTHFLRMVRPPATPPFEVRFETPPGRQAQVDFAQFQVVFSVPDATRKRVVEVHTLACEIRIFEDGTPIATHPVLEGRGRRRVAPGHRKLRVVAEHAKTTADTTLIAARPGERVGRRSLAVYATVGRRLAGRGERT